MKRGKKRFIVCAMSVLFLYIGFILLPQAYHTTLSAAGATFSPFDEVVLANDTYKVISDDGTTIKLLKDDTVDETLQTWASANTQAKNYPTVDKVGVLGSEALKNKFSLPLSTDLTSITTSNTLDANIPLVSDDWWLGDPTVNNRSKFISKENKDNVVNEYEIWEINGTIYVDPVCNTKTEKAIGMKITEDANQNFDTQGVLLSTSAIFNVSASGTVEGYSNGDCTGNLISKVTLAGTGTDGVAYLAWKSTDGVSSWDGGSSKSNGGDIEVITGLNPALRIWLGQGESASLEKVKVLSDYNRYDSQTVSYAKDACMTAYTDTLGEIMGSTSIKSYKAKTAVSVSLYKKVNYSFLDFNRIGGGRYRVTVGTNRVQVPCTGPALKAGTALARPMVTLSSTDVIATNASKRSYNVGNTLTDSFPSASGGNAPYITLKNTSMNVNLQSGAEGVSGTTYTVDNPSNGILKLPITLTSNSEGKRYVSASATVNRDTRYGVLKEFASGETQGEVEINLSSLSDNPDSLSSVNLTLYLEDEGLYNTSYMSAGTPITVNLVNTKASQEIAFDEGQNNSVTYGDTITLTSSVSSADKNTSDIVYSIKSGDATIVSQSYADGKATATISPTSGSGTVVVAINKAGDANTMAAAEKTYEVTLNKKELTVSAKKPSKTYRIGEVMPTIESECTDLVQGDTLPSVLVPVLENMDGTNTAPDVDGKIAVVGTWKLVYPSGVLDTVADEFKNKYTITLQDWDEDTTCVLETELGSIPDGWIVVTPATANDEGWNKQDVVISLSDEAKAEGYTIEVIHQNGDVLQTGVTITYGESLTVDGDTPQIRLKNNNGTTEPVSIRTIKVDKTAPQVSNVSVEKESTWSLSKKTVTITATDALSGIKSITASCNGKTYAPALQANNTYTFDADQNGDYVISVSDNADNTTSITTTIEKITEASLSLSVTPETMQATKPKQKISIAWDAGASGVKEFYVSLKNEDGNYTKLEDFSTDASSFDWYAEMNGEYRFTLNNNVGESETVDVGVTMVSPPYPVTQITAYEKDTPLNTYTSGTWTNKDITLDITNVNSEVVDTITWTYSEDDGATWKTLNPTSFSISTDTYISKNLQFKAKIDKGGVGDIEEQSVKSISVQIDKTAPKTPAIQDADSYTEDAWFKDAQTISASVDAKATNIKQDIYMCEGTSSDCENLANWSIMSQGTTTILQNGTHELYFKTIDEAGNVSEITQPIYVNINNASPQIQINVENDPLASFLNNITLGYFFKETKTLNFAVSFGNNQSGKVYYILDDTNAQAPTENDARWIEGTSVNIEPDANVMVYVKAVSDAGVTAITSSLYHVYVDNEAPVINTQSMRDWSTSNHVTVQITDNNAGVDPAQVQYQIDQGTLTKANFANGSFTVNNLKDGEYLLRVEAKDNSGNLTTKDIEMMIDTTKPVIRTPTAQPSGWAKEKTITFSATDATSDIDVGTVKVKNGNVTVSQNLDGTWNFPVTANGDYEIEVADQAGNTQTLTYTEANIDTIPPSIANIKIEHENDWKASKKVSFELTDNQSGIDEITIQYVIDAQTKTVQPQLDIDGKTYYFTASEEAEYIVNAKDTVGNEMPAETIKVEKIDTSAISIINISDTTTWTKDTKDISFAIRQGQSGIKTGYPKVSCDGVDITPTQANGSYTFSADKNSSYTITVQSNSGEEDTQTLTISTIDKRAITIQDISENTTSNEWREPQTISFHVVDDNDDAGTAGSGIKSGYPILYYIKDGTKVDVSYEQDVNDPTLYRFVADQNVDYIVEAQDVVEYGVVAETISVDHIINADDMLPLDVVATFNNTAIQSQTWVKGPILFTISGGYASHIVEKYQVAVTQDIQSIPEESSWQDVNTGSNQHEVTANVNKDVYWFRAYPIIDPDHISQPFVVCIDRESPSDVEVQLTPINVNPIARFIHALSFGRWMNQAQEVSFSASDNYTATDDITYMYYEERNGVKGNWNTYKGSLTYNDTDIKLYVKAIDLAGNESAEIPQELAIDSVPPVISGAKDQSEYKYYYLPRYITVTDQGSGIKESSYQLDNGTVIPFNNEVSLDKIGTYSIYALDEAENEAELTFKIVPLPTMNEIDGSDEAKEIIEQVKEELEEGKAHFDANETANFEKWIDDAQGEWESQRIHEVIDSETNAKIEGKEDTSFDPEVELVVEEIAINDLPDLPKKAMQGYDVQLKKNDKKVELDGTVQVYLPYTKDTIPTVYEIYEDGSVKEISVTIENGNITFTSDALRKYAITTDEDEPDPTPTPDPDEKPDPDPNPDNPTPDTKPDTDTKPDPDTCPADINYDSDSDGKPDVNIDVTGDCKADINIDTDGDHIPDIDIDTIGDGKPNYNVDTNGDKQANLNIGAVVWKPNLCKSVNTISYCTSSYYKPYLNIDSDSDARPDISIDLDKDGLPDINIDLNYDNIPDINIDTKGDTEGSLPDGKPDINIDMDDDGTADINIVKLTEWKPDTDVDGRINYDTMIGIEAIYNVDTTGDGQPDKNIADNTDNKLIIDMKDTQDAKDTSVQGNYTTTTGGVGGAQTGEGVDWKLWWGVVGISICSFSFTAYRKRALKQRINKKNR